MAASSHEGWVQEMERTTIGMPAYQVRKVQDDPTGGEVASSPSIIVYADDRVSAIEQAEVAMQNYPGRVKVEEL